MGPLYLLLQMCHDCFLLSNFPSRPALESEPTRSWREVCPLSICSWVFLWGYKIQRNGLVPKARGLHHLLSHQQVQDLVETVTGLCTAALLWAHLPTSPAHPRGTHTEPPSFPIPTQIVILSSLPLQTLPLALCKKASCLLSLSSEHPQNELL